MELKLKARNNIPAYYSAQKDFKDLVKLLNCYQQYFTNQRVYPADKYNTEVSRLRLEATASETANMSLPTDLADLLKVYQYIEAQELYYRVTINTIFITLYSYFVEAYSDFTIGYLSDSNFDEMLKSYDQVIQKSKECRLASHEKSMLLQIEKEIAKL